MNGRLSVHEIAAALVSLISVGALFALAILQIPIPAELAAVAGAATTWLFVHSSVQTEHEHADAVRAFDAKKEV